MQPWTFDETLVAFYVYSRVPFARVTRRHPLVVECARLIGRTPSALGMKVGNLGRWDTSLRARGIVGLRHGARLEGAVWEAFNADPEGTAVRCEELVARYRGEDVVTSAGVSVRDLPLGETRERVVRARIGQSFFRAAVLSAYGERCCVTGLGAPQLLEACHIVSWQEDAPNRTNPCNGLCLNVLLHRAYDSNLFAVTPDYEVVVSDTLQRAAGDNALCEWIVGLAGSQLRLPDKFLPDRELLSMHFAEYLAAGM